MIQSCRGDGYSCLRHLKHQNLYIISDYVGIPNGSKKKWENEWGGAGVGTEWRNLIHIEEDLGMFEAFILSGFFAIGVKGTFGAFEDMASTE